jgi:hypothetical protein
MESGKGVFAGGFSINGPLVIMSLGRNQNQGTRRFVADL